MNQDKFLKDLEDMIAGEGNHASHRQELAGRCLYCSCGSRAQLTPRAIKQARERLKGSPGIQDPRLRKRRWQVTIYDDERYKSGFVCLTTTKEEDADASVARHKAKGKRAVKEQL